MGGESQRESTNQQVQVSGHCHNDILGFFQSHDHSHGTTSLSLAMMARDAMGSNTEYSTSDVMLPRAFVAMTVTMGLPLCRNLCPVIGWSHG